MKNKRLILISLLLLLTIISAGAAVASEDISIENKSVDNGDMSIIATDINEELNSNAQNDENLASDLEKSELETNLEESILESEVKENSKESIKDKNNLKSNKLASTITVDGSAYNQMSNPTIQNAIDSANAGDTIIITGTEYVHCHFIINKQLTIISEVGTTMSPCPSNRRGSGAIGIFYISPEASGTIIKGFNLTNTYGDSDDYGILIRGANGVEIENCTINTVSDGDGIRVENTENTLIHNCLIQNSNIGINLTASTKTSITNNNITGNTITGVNVGLNNKNTTIHTNNITYNQHSGIDLYSGEYIYIINNFIGYNQNPRSSSGAGIYVNNNITKVEIKGNFIKQNGQYGVLNDYRVRNMNANIGAENLEINNNNYFLGHTERIAYHIEYSKYKGGPFNYDSENDVYVYVGDGNGNYDIGKTVVYLGYAFFRDETVCGATLFKAPDVTWGNDVYKLELSPMTQVKKGVYSVSIIDKNGNVAKDLSSIYVTFYLNKNNNYADPQEGDIYKTVLMQNGTATADFTDVEFAESNNTIIASFPGLYSLYTINPYVKFEVNDSDIPGTYRNTEIDAKNTNLVPSSGEYLTAKIIDENGNPVAGASISIKIDGVSKTYEKISAANGEIKLKINLAKEKTYKVTFTFNGNENYNKSSKSVNLVIKKQTPKINSSNVELIPSSGEKYEAKFTDANGNPIAEKEMTFTVGKHTYTKTTDADGIAKLTINLAKEGKYTVTIKFPKTNQYNAVSKTNTITIKAGANKVTITSSDKTYIPKSGEYFSIKLSDKDGNSLSGKKVTFSIGSKTYAKTTNDEGIAKLAINLAKLGKYSMTTKFAGDEIYSQASKTNTVTIKKASAKLITYNRTYVNKSGQYFTAKLTDNNDNPLSGENITLNVGKGSYTKTTDENGMVKLKINLVKNYNITSKFAGNAQYNGITNTNTITVTDEIEKAYIDKNLKNDEIQRIIDEISPNYSVEFLGKEYNDISLNVNKTLVIYSNINTTLNGKAASPVFTLSGDNIAVSYFNINANSNDGEGYGIILNNTKEAVIDGNNIQNILNPDIMDDYRNGSTILPGHGIELIDSSDALIEGNDIGFFESGIYTEYSNGTLMRENKVTNNNYGIKYGFGNANTEIFNNTIIDNIGWYTEEVPEGPRGYGLYFNSSAVNVTVYLNNISNNYIGISVDSNNSTGIVITSNLIADNSLEGIRFNAGYDLAENAVEPLITDNAIYRNAEGPSLMILGEMSANPFGIYGPGQWNDSLKLQIAPNWYGVNQLRTWDNDTGIVGVGTMCPRIKTTTIKFDKLESVGPGSYKIDLYKNGSFASNLASFDMYATLNKNSEKKAEVHFYVENGTGTFTFDKANYLESGNTIELSVGSLINVVDRIYTSFFIYDVPNEEIPA